MGVSATHLDWTLVPYVRKSFFKHYRDGLEFLCNEVIDETIKDSASIDDIKIYKNEKVYKYAMDMTEREVYQAVEGMYHNLNIGAT